MEVDAVPFGAITLWDLAACGRRGLFYKKFLGVFRRSFSVGAAHWAARLVFCLLGCFAVPSCFSLPPGGEGGWPLGQTDEGAMIEFLRLSWGCFAAPAASFFLDAQKEANGPGHLLLALRANSP